ncbi:aspartyl/asparaginyl beta-hydroxylase-like isoform X7 [Nerophis lumbriciformis]|uniref:aspartyl/asparaginyl beta-hydroxylase-like isoform X7 n=1 Tax=Nerophis lumbriciformis TaxID=546530 RepID=UPI002AE0141A|nr:aspartyl/asparaginyl beta-hydroxylase-like isoform X2 [Nerophis lumbriciformis]
MQRYRHYGTSSSTVPVEELHATEEEVSAKEQEEEPLVKEEPDDIQTTGGMDVEEAPSTQEAHLLSESKPPPSESKNGKKTHGGDAGGGAKYSVFTWFVVLALLGVWSSVAVVYFDVVDYNSVIGKLKAYDTDGDGDFDVEDAKVLLAKKKKAKLLNKLDKTIKAEVDAAEKLRKKGKVEAALKAFETLVQQHPQSPRARYGKAQAEDDLAEKKRSNDMLLKAINSYREAAELPDANADLIRAALKRRAERQQFLGRMRGAVATLERLVQMFPEDIGLKNDLGVSYLLLGDNKGAKKVYKEVLAAAPDDGFAKVHYGFILKSENKIAESIPYLKEGLESGEPGTDDGRFYFHLGDALQRVGDKSAYHWYQLGHERGHFASVWQRSLYNVDGLKAQPWWTPSETGYTDLVKALERNWKTIRDEALAMMDSNTGMFVPEEENLREKGEWGQYTLWQQGRKAVDACQTAPKTCSLLEKFPEATGCKRGQIKFSVMQPGTHVWPHTGPTNCRLRMHLGLVVPKHGCRIRCTDQTREWEEGKVLIFDDSFEHEVWQEADAYRLIFIVDVWHPQLTAQQRQTLSAI